jgi:hypothetical protein
LEAFLSFFFFSYRDDFFILVIRVSFIIIRISSFRFYIRICIIVILYTVIWIFNYFIIFLIYGKVFPLPDKTQII